MATWFSWSGFLGALGIGTRPAEQRLQSGAAAAGAGDLPETVTFDTAMQVSAVFAASRLLAETISCMPFDIYERAGNVPAETLALRNLLLNKPNRYQTRIGFFETVILNLCTSGNAYVLRQKNTLGDLIGLMPLTSRNMTVEVLDDGALLYQYVGRNEVIKEYREADIWHVRLFGNGIMGMSPLSFAAGSVSVGLSAARKTTGNFANGGKPYGYVKSPAFLNDAQRTAIGSQLSELQAGRLSRVPVLEGGMSFEAVSLSPADMQLLETRKYTVEDIARFWGVPSVLINDTGGSTVWGSGIGEIVTGFYKLNLRPYLERLEESIRIDLLSVADRDKYVPAFDFDSLMRADTATRVKNHQTMVLSGQMTINEARQAEGRSRVDGGDVVLVPVNMTTLDRVNDPALKIGGKNGT